MIQIDSNRWEEYNSLRMELVQLLAHGRNVLTATVTFIIVSFAWYLSQTPEIRITVTSFAVFTHMVLVLSVAVYTTSINQALRIGGFLAVFWESSDPDRRLIWHRFNRRGPTSVFLPDMAVLIYTAGALLVTALVGLHALTRQTDPFEPVTTVLFFGLANVFIYAQIGGFVRRKRDAFEREWLLIRASRERQAEIHRMYETLPAA